MEYAKLFLLLCVCGAFCELGRAEENVLTIDAVDPVVVAAADALQTEGAEGSTESTRKVRQYFGPPPPPFFGPPPPPYYGGAFGGYGGYGFGGGYQRTRTVTRTRTRVRGGYGGFGGGFGGGYYG